MIPAQRLYSLNGLTFNCLLLQNFTFIKNSRELAATIQTFKIKGSSRNLQSENHSLPIIGEQTEYYIG